MGREGKKVGGFRDEGEHPRVSESSRRASLSAAFQFESLENRLLLSADFLPVDARISVPGETDTYTFTLTEPRNLLLDARDAPPGLNWALSTAAGDALVERSFANSEIARVANPVLSLGPGSYRLTISGAPGVEGDYRFRLIDIAQSEGIEPGTALDLVQEVAREARVLHFDAVEGAQYELVAPGSDADWQVTLIAPSGAMVQQVTSLRTFMFDRMEEKGRYRFVVEGARSQTAAGAVSVLLRQAAGPLSEAAETRFSAAIDARITGTTAGDGGRVHVHDFTLSEATTLFWQGGASADHRVSLRGPGGMRHDLPVGDIAGMQLEAGAWELRIEAVTVAPRSYDVALLSAASAVQVTARAAFGVDAEVSLNNLDERALVAINVPGPGLLTLKGSYTQLQILVIAPDGGIVADSMGADDVRVATAGAGTYLVALRKTVTWRGPLTTLSSEFRDWTASESLVYPGDVLTGTLAGGDTRMVRIIGDGAPLLIDGWPGVSGLRWDVSGRDTGSRTTFVFNNTSLSQGNAGRVVLPTQDGVEYLLTLRNVSNAAVSYELALQGFAAAPVLGATPRDMVFDPGHRLQLVRFDPKPVHDRVLVEGHVSRTFQLYDAEGRPVGAQFVSNGLRLPEGATGPLWLAIEPPASITGPVTLTVRLAGALAASGPVVGPRQGAAPAIIDEGPDGLGALVLQPGTGLRVDPSEVVDLAGDFTLEARFFFDTISARRMPLILQRSGTNSNVGIQVQTNGRLQGSVRAGAGWAGVTSDENLIKAGQWHHIIMVGDRSGGEMRLYLDGVEVGRVSREGLGLSNADALVFSSAGTNFEDPVRGRLAGLVLHDTALDEAAVAARMAGEMTAGAPVLAYRFDDPADPLAAATGPQGRAVYTGLPTGGDVISGAVRGADKAFFEIDLAAPTRLYVDRMVGGLRLSGPDGNSRILNLRGNVLNLGPGKHVLEVAGAGAFAFRLIDLDMVETLVPNAPLREVVLPGPKAASVFAFEGKRDLPLSIDWAALGAAPGLLRVALYDTDGTRLHLANTLSAFSDILLPRDGLYFLAFEGDEYSAADVPVRLRAGLRHGPPVPKILAATAYTPDWLPEGLNLRGVESAHFDSAMLGDIERAITLSAAFALDTTNLPQLITTLVRESDGLEVATLGIDSNNRVFARVLSGFNHQGNPTFTTRTDQVVREAGVRIEVDLVLDRDASEMVLYVNGEQASRGVVSDSWFADAGALVVGGLPRLNADERFHGRLFGLSLRAGAADAATRAAGHAGTADLADPGLRLSLNFSEGAGGFLFNRAANGGSRPLEPVVPDLLFSRRDSRNDVSEIVLDLDAPGFFLLQSFGDRNHGLTLTGPAGEIFSNRQFSSGFSTLDLLALGPGRHVLSISGFNAPGDFAVRLLDLGDPSAFPEIVPGVAQSVDLASARGGAVFRLDAAADRDFSLFESNGRPLNWTLIEAESPLANATAPRTGTSTQRAGVYYLLVHRTVDTPLDREFTLFDRETTAEPLALSAEVSGIVPGRFVAMRHDFTLAEEGDILVDWRAGNNNLRWEVLDSAGNVVVPQRAWGDTSYGSQARFTTLGPGDYTLRVLTNISTATNIGYRVAIHDARQIASDIALNEVASGRLPGTQRGVAVYAVDVADRKMVSFGRADGPFFQGVVQVVSASGEVVYSGNQPNDQQVLLTGAGRWYVIFDGSDFAQETVANTSDSHRLLLANDGRVPTIGETTVDFNTPGLGYVLDNQRGAAPRLINDGANRFLRLTGLTDSNTLNVLLLDRMHDGDLEVAELAFDYRAATPGGVGTQGDGFTLGWLPSTTLGDTGRVDFASGFQFTSIYNDAVYLDLQIRRTAAGDETNRLVLRRGTTTLHTLDLGESLAVTDFARMRFVLAEAQGGVEAALFLAREGEAEVTLAQGLFIGDRLTLGEGRFAIRANTTFGATAEHDFDNITVTATPRATAPLAFDTLYSATFDGRGASNNRASDRYDLVLDSPRLVLFDPLSGSTNLSIRLLGAGQDTTTTTLPNAHSGSFNFPGVLSLDAGRYQLHVEGPVSGEASYSFRMLDLGAGTPININSETGITVDPGNGTQAYVFDGNAGDTFWVEGLTHVGDSLRLRLLDPDGAQLRTTTSFSSSPGTLNPVTLAQDGRHVLLVAGALNQPAPKDFTFALHRVDPVRVPLQLDTLADASIDLAGRVRIFDVTLDAPDIVLVDPGITDSSLIWEMWQGEELIETRRFSETSLASGRSPAALVLDAGSYTLVVRTASPAADTYTATIALRSFSGAGVLAPLDVVDVEALDVWGTRATDVWRIDRAGGEREVLALGQHTGITLTLLDANGYAVGTRVTAASQMPIDMSDLPAGSYFLVMERNRASFASDTVLSRPAKGAVASPAFDERIQLDPGTAGLSEVRFTLDDRDFVQMSLLGAATGTQWTLTAPDGSVLSDVVSSGRAHVLWRLDAGEHVLRVSGAAPGSVALSRGTDAPPLEAGLPALLRLSPADGVALFDHQGEGGAEVVIAPAWGSAKGQLAVFDQAGRQLAQGPLGTHLRLTLPDDGRILVQATGTGAPSDPAQLAHIMLVAGLRPAEVVLPRPGGAAGANLVVRDLAASGAAIAGGTLTLNWTTTNDGSEIAPGTFSERLVVRNSDTGALLHARLLPLDPGGAGLAPGGTIARQAVVDLPPGIHGTGQIEVWVHSDALNRVEESAPDGLAEFDNAARIDVVALDAAFPNLVAQVIILPDPADWVPGAEITVSWRSGNEGNAPAEGGWTEQVLLFRGLPNAGSQLVAVRDVVVSDPLAAGDSVLRDATFTLPDGDAARDNFYFEVRLDTGGEVVESAPGIDAEADNRLTATIIAAPDVAISGLSIATAVPEAGAPLDFTFTITNDGLVAAPNIGGHRVFLRSSNSGQLFLDTLLPGVEVPSGDSVSVSARIDVPLDAVGDLRLEVDLNRTEGWPRAFTERDPETGNDALGNNFVEIQFEVVAALRSDLVTTVPVVPASVDMGAPFVVTWQVANEGAAATELDGWTDRVILTQADAPGGPGDVILGDVPRNGALLPSDSYEARLETTLPALAPGIWRVFVIADVAEVLDAPGTRASNTSGPAEFEAVLPDLNLAAGDVALSSARVFSGTEIDVSWRVTATGSQVAPAGVVDRVWLSSGAVPGPNAVLLGEIVAASPLAPGQSRAEMLRVMLPADAAGALFIVIETDATAIVAESDEDDNFAAAMLEIQSRPAPDLAAGAIVAPTSANSGSTVEISFTVTNNGAEAARGPWTDRIFLRNATTGNFVRNLLDVSRSVDLALGASYTVTQNVLLQGFLSGEYLIAVTTDAFGQVFEAGLDGNNTALASEPITIGRPDLAVAALSAPDTGTAGSPINLSYQVSNTSAFDAFGGWTDTLWLSADGTLGPDAVRVADVLRQGPIDAGGSRVETIEAELPLGVAGNLFLVIQVNSDGGILEGGAVADNNFASRAIDVADTDYPDLTIASFTPPAELRGTFFQGVFDWTVQNDGAAGTRATGWADELWLIDSAGRETLLGRFARDGALAAGASYSRSEEISFAVKDGVYRVELRVDTGGAVFQGAGAVPATAARQIVLSRGPHADLRVRDVTAETEVVAGQLLTVQWVVENVGAISTAEAFNPSPRIVDRVRLVPVGGGTTGSASLTRVAPLVLGPGGSYSATLEFAVPLWLSGTFRVEVETNSDNGVYELFRDDNVALGPEVTVTPAQLPDLRVDNLELPPLLTEGDVLDIAWRVSNNGAAGTLGPFREIVRFTPNLGSGHSQTVLAEIVSEHGGALAPGEERLRSIRIDSATIAGILRGGIIEVQVAGLPGQPFPEPPGGGDDNRISGVLLVDALARPDLEVTTITAPASVQAGDTVTLDFLVENIGSVAADGRWTDRVLLSASPDASLAIPGAIRVDNPSALAPGESYASGPVEFTLPITAAGQMWLIVEANWGTSPSARPLDEGVSVANNRLAIPIEVLPAPLADLVVSDVTAPDQVLAGATASVSYTVTNLGDAATRNAAQVEQIWLTRDRTRPRPAASGGDILLSTMTRDTGLMGPGAGYDVTAQVVIPDHLETGRWYITPWVDPFGAEPERTFSENINPDDPATPDSNNFKAGGGATGEVIVIGRPAPVLRADVAAVDVSAVEVAGSDGVEWDFTLSFENRGQTTLQEGKWGWFLDISETPAGTGETYNLDFWTLLGGSMVAPELRPGESYSETRRIVVGPHVKGSYVTLRAVVPGDANPDNNVAFLAERFDDTFTDLAVTDLTLPPGPLAIGESVEISYTVTNLAPRAVWPGTERLIDQIWLSAGPGDDRLRQLAIERVELPDGLAAGASYTRTIMVDIPDDLPPGDYRIHARANNPIVSGSLRGLYFDSHYYEIPSTTFGGGRLGGFANRAYDDWRMGNIVGQAVTLVADYPDLVIERFDAPESVVAGEVFEAEIEVRNTGSQTAQVRDGWLDRLFLSRGASIDPDSHLLLHPDPLETNAAQGTLRTAALAPGESYVTSIRARVHHSFEGDFTLIAMTDAGDYVGVAPQPGIRPASVAATTAAHDLKEGPGEGNNTAARAISVLPAARPELVITELSLPERIVAGEEVRLSYTIANEGADLPDPSQRIALDLAFVPPGGDPGAGIEATLPRRQIMLDAIPGGQNVSGEIVFRVPVTVVPDAYVVRLRVDPPLRGPFGEVLETPRGEAEGARFVPVIIDLPPPPIWCPPRCLRPPRWFRVTASPSTGRCAMTAM